jgi:hypothetical protein
MTTIKQQSYLKKEKGCLRAAFFVRFGLEIVVRYGAKDAP